MAMKRVFGLFILCILSVSMLCGCGGRKREFSEFTWPSSEAAAQLPVPESTVGEISLEKDDYFSVDIAEISKEQYDAYVEQCKSKGFTLDYSNAGSYYTANSEAGYHLYVSYDERDGIMDLSVSKIDDEDSEETQTADVESMDTSYDQIEDIADDSEDSEDEEDEEDSSDDEVNPKLKKSLDTYEKFMDKYIKFMKKYKKDPLKYMDEYADMLNEYTEEMEEIDDMDQGEFSTADAAYYLEVTSRVAKKLAKINE